MNNRSMIEFIECKVLLYMDFNNDKYRLWYDSPWNMLEYSSLRKRHLSPRELIELGQVEELFRVVKVVLDE